MGTYTLSDFKNKLEFEIHRDDQTDNLTGWINTAAMTLTTKDKLWGVRGLNKRYYFPDLETSETKTTSDGVAYISTPSDCLIVRTVYDTTNDTKLTKISWREYTDYTDRADTDQEGEPNEYCRQGAYIYVHKTPDDEYDLDVFYRKRITALSDNDDVLEIGAEWDEPVLQLAVIQTHMRLDEFDKAEAKKKEWIEIVAGVIGIYGQEELDREDVRKPSYSYLEGFKYRA